ncbi:uncharacterized protein [Parasteatoda tepidariorum]|uniref:uncharacterized protein n=1 Tax=Parasteatoda tepidariorum TaxID=114398 RepID=UPI00077FB74F|nr:uncharacterized protein LOC107448637 [Parasteatoda tepidariorum]XP_042901767.1 uncharacterized protein LOC107448637 [Parasteatoda tepidariorum]XP_042901768.1 uncharacterized protein LOC107448637 [Parasteatoda tepidariorum]
MATEVTDTETQLITYCKSILKYQIIPMDFMNLRGLVKEERKNKQLYKFIEDKYPGTQFIEFLKKYPDIFSVNPNRSVVLTEGNSFTLPYADAAKNSTQTVDVDEVDGYNRAEYVSDSDSDGAENDDLLKKDERQKVADMWSTSSSDSESSVDVFSSELVHTSDSNQSSLTSTSASEN